MSTSADRNGLTLSDTTATSAMIAPFVHGDGSASEMSRG
jgi:hypothetical protein